MLSIVYYRELRYDKFCRRMAQLWITALLIAHGVEVIQTENCVGCSSLYTQFSLLEFALLVLFTVYCGVGQTRQIKTNTANSDKENCVKSELQPTQFSVW